MGFAWGWRMWCAGAVPVCIPCCLKNYFTQLLSVGATADAQIS